MIEFFKRKPPVESSPEEQKQLPLINEETDPETWVLTSSVDGKRGEVAQKIKVIIEGHSSCECRTKAVCNGNDIGKGGSYKDSLDALSHEKRVTEFTTIRTDPDFQNKQIATAQIHLLAKYAKKQVINIIIGTINPYNDGLTKDELKHYYSRIGFKIIEETRNTKLIGNVNTIIKETEKRLRKNWESEV